MAMWKCSCGRENRDCHTNCKDCGKLDQRFKDSPAFKKKNCFIEWFKDNGGWFMIGAIVLILIGLNIIGFTHMGWLAIGAMLVDAGVVVITFLGIGTGC